MNKQKELDKITEEIKICAICKIDTIGIAVPGEGNPDAKVVFIGEAPGKNEAREGRPFIGRSGKYLRSLIQKLGLDDTKDTFITSPVHYLPKRGTPNPKEIAHGRIHLIRQFDVIQPQIIVLMGSVAVQGVLQEKIPVRSRHGEIITKNGKQYFITLHPAAALRFPQLRREIESDFEKLKTVIKE